MNSLSVQVEQRVPSLVNTATMRVPVGGKVRPGIKILTKAAKQHDAAVRIYSAGVAEGKSFEQIEREISSSVPGLKNPLVMRNVAWFTVRPGDFANPALAKQIMDLYATDLGDGNGRRLYRFPAVFVADDLKVVMPSALRCFTRSELRFWSEYGPDRVRYCMTRAPVPRTPEGKVVRLFGGRQIVHRPDNEGRCDPLVCAEYQRKECNLSASFVFYIPGVASLQPLEMPFTSVYALAGAEGVFAMVQSMRGGRISGFLDAGQTFWFSKVEKDVPHIDLETGEPRKVRHLIITLEANVDPTRLLRQRDDAVERAARFERAAVTIEGDAAVHPDTASHETTDTPVAEGSDVLADPLEVAGSEGATATEATVTTAAAVAHPAPVAAKSGEAASAQRRSVQGAPVAGIDEALANLVALLTEIGIEPERFASFARKKWGPGWKVNAKGTAHALAHVVGLRNDVDTLRHQIENQPETVA